MLVVDTSIPVRDASVPLPSPSHRSLCPPVASGLAFCFGVALLLGGCGGGSSGSASPTPAPPATGTPPPTGLFTDAQLATAEDQNAALASPEASAWFSDNAKIIRSLGNTEDYSDLNFFTPLLAQKRIVLLGESSHGVREYSAAKIRLIRYLHEVQGFDRLAFEGGLFDCERAQALLEAGAAQDALRACLFGVWQTEALLDLFEYARETQATARPLRLTGFDVQASGARFAERASATGALFEKLSAQRAADVRAIEQNYRQLVFDALNAQSENDASMTALVAALDDIAVDYIAMADELLASRSTISADGEFSEQEILIAVQYAATSPFYAQQVSERFQNGRGNRPRDQGMGRNLIALANTIYPDEKIIVWAHNAHLRHGGAGFVVGGNMGAVAHEALSDQMYTIGFYMYRGEHAFNDRRIEAVRPPLNQSLEAIFHTRRLAWLFLDLENAPQTPGHEWIYMNTSAWAWGSVEVSMRLAEEYDGLLIIDKATPPIYLDP